MEFNFDELPATEECGRVNASKKICKFLRDPFTPACPRHATDDEVRDGRLILRAWQGGFRTGKRQSTQYLEADIEALKREVEALKRAEFRHHDGQTQLVEVDGFAYRWSGRPDLEEGEEIVLPGNHYSRRRGYRDEWPGVVTRLGTRYWGPYPEVVRRKSDTRKK